MVHRRGGGLENPLPERAALAGPFAERMGKKGLHAHHKVLQATGRWKASSFHHPAPGGGSRLSGPGMFSPGGGDRAQATPHGPPVTPLERTLRPGVRSDCRAPGVFLPAGSSSCPALVAAAPPGRKCPWCPECPESETGQSSTSTKGAAPGTPAERAAAARVPFRSSRPPTPVASGQVSEGPQPTEGTGLVSGSAPRSPRLRPGTTLLARSRPGPAASWLPCKKARGGAGGVAVWLVPDCWSRKGCIGLHQLDLQRGLPPWPGSRGCAVQPGSDLAGLGRLGTW